MRTMHMVSEMLRYLPSLDSGPRFNRRLAAVDAFQGVWAAFGVITCPLPLGEPITSSLPLGHPLGIPHVGSPIRGPLRLDMQDLSLR